ncbi:hypothetical protein VB712_14610 [Spirulina sp. CCNP1310]|nr:hypothetical protein [Spirulina sp. CCNP1310]
MIKNSNRNNILEIINSSDAKGVYVDNADLEKLKEYFQAKAQRITVVVAISSNVTAIIKETMAKQSSLANCFSKNHTTRQYAACMRDLSFFLQYLNYAILADDISLLDDPVLDGVTEIYTVLNISIDTTVKFIRAMQEATSCIVGHENSYIIADSFDYLCDKLTQKLNVIESSVNVVSESFKDGQASNLKNDSEWLYSDNWLTNLIGSISDESAFVKALEYGRSFRQSDQLIDADIE